MIDVLKRRAAKAGLTEQIDTRVCPSNSLEIEDLTGQVNFALAFAVIHEVPDASSVFAQIYSALRPNGKLLLVEPGGHVSQEEFRQTEAIAKQAGFASLNYPSIRCNWTAALQKVD
ncbi:MAG: hypothetical protein DRP47_04630 [Candidatus Zixiibacteriota bacterium]|nr:MAG: hypothetical protein DRP47_04630 [candidate division Zixibacteria bacterium]